MRRITSGLILIMGCTATSACREDGISVSMTPPGSADMAQAPDLGEVPVGFRCGSKAPPTTAPDPALVRGTATNSAGAPVAGAALIVRRRSDGSTLTSATADAFGRFSLSIPTGGSPIDAWMTVSAPGMVDDNYFFYGRPLSDSITIDYPLFTPAEVAQLATEAGQTWDTRKGMLAAQVLDCSGKDIRTDITLRTSPAPDGWLLDHISLAINLPVGEVIIDGDDGAAGKLHEVRVRSFAGALTTVTLAP